MRARTVLGLAACLCLISCDDSQKPLSDPLKAKPDNRLFGVWRHQGDDGEISYYHVGPAGEKFPEGVMRVIEVTHAKDKVDRPDEYFAFPTVLNGKTYLNVVYDGDKKPVALLNEKGWSADAVECYTFFKYEVEVDRLVLWMIDEEAKERAIKGGKIKGILHPSAPDTFTDTAENVARFIAEAGDSLLNLKDPVRIERIAAGKKP